MIDWMNQSQIVGKLVAAGRARYQADAKDPKKGSYVFLANRGFAWKIEQIELEKLDLDLSQIADCLDELAELGSIDDLRKKFHHRSGQGPYQYGIKIISKSNPRLMCNVVLQSSQVEDCDVLLSWFYDNHNDKMEQLGPAERAVAPTELLAVERARGELAMESLDPVEQFFAEKEAEQAAIKRKQLKESKNKKGEIMERKVLSERVDGFGLPLVESEELHHVGHTHLGGEPGMMKNDGHRREAPLDDKKVKPTHIKDAGIKQAHVHGEGESEEQMTDVTSKVKPRKPLDPPAHVMAEMRMLRRRVAKLSEAVALLSEEKMKHEMAMKKMKKEGMVDKKAIAEKVKAKLKEKYESKKKIYEQDDLAAQDKVMGTVDDVRVIHTLVPFGKDSRIGKHILNPTQRELDKAIDDAMKDRFPAVYVHGKSSLPLVVERKKYAKLKEAVLSANEIRSECSKIMSVSDNMSGTDAETVRQACQSILALVDRHEEEMMAAQPE